MLRIAWVSICAALLLDVPVQAQQWSDLETTLEGRELTMRRTVEGRRKLYLGDGTNGAFVLFRGGLFPLRASELVRITDADSEDDHIELRLESSRLGEGRVDFFGTAPTAENFEPWLDEVFEVATADADFHRYVGNRESRTLHLRGANHLPPVSNRVLFHQEEDAVNDGYHRCGVCFHVAPDVSDYQNENALALLSLQQVRSTYYPYLGEERQDEVERIGERVLAEWPIPLKGYRYRFQVLDTDQVNAFAVPTGYVFVTRGLLESIETDGELAAILAHEISHVESRHGYRLWRNAQGAATGVAIAGAILGGLTGTSSSVATDIFSVMSSIAAQLFMAGHGRDREREADLFASLYLDEAGIEEAPLISAFKKLQFARDAIDPFDDGRGGLFASHPDIGERLARASVPARSFSTDEVFHGISEDGARVATLRFDIQRLFGNELDVIATLSTTAELGEADDVDTLYVNGIELRERTAENVYPSDEVSAVFGNDNASGLVQTPIGNVRLELRNVERWIKCASTQEPVETAVQEAEAALLAARPEQGRDEVFVRNIAQVREAATALATQCANLSRQPY